MPSVLEFFSDPHYQVRLAAINAMDEFSKHLMPELQLHCNEDTVPKLLAVMDDSGGALIQVIVPKYSSLSLSLSSSRFHFCLKLLLRNYI